jgi:hypothetical protein
LKNKLDGDRPALLRGPLLIVRDELTIAARGYRDFRARGFYIAALSQ